jgi:hypothetical protein
MTASADNERALEELGRQIATDIGRLSDSSTITGDAPGPPRERGAWRESAAVRRARFASSASLHRLGVPVRMHARTRSGSERQDG